MRLHPAFAFALPFLASGSVARAADPSMATPAGYERRTLEGFTVFANQQMLDRPVDRFGRRPLDVLEKELNDLKRILVPKIVAVLQEVPIWAEWDDADKAMPGAIAVYYHGSPEALKTAGGDPRKAGCIVIVTLRVLGEIRRPGTALQQVVTLHEMAHAVHDRLLGMTNPELEAIFKQATDRKLYEQVNDRFGRTGKAYARTNAAEYFAEISCAYLDSCNYFPFNQEQLRGYDPVGYKFVERVWTQPERFAAIARRPKAGPAGEAAAASVSPEAVRVRTGVAAERDALMKLDQLKVLLRQGQTASAKKGLEQLVRNFPGSDAAADARQMLKQMK
jgi:hypothetical protein